MERKSWHDFQEHYFCSQYFRSRRNTHNYMMAICLLYQSKRNQWEYFLRILWESMCTMTHPITTTHTHSSPLDVSFRYVKIEIKVCKWTSQVHFWASLVFLKRWFKFFLNSLFERCRFFVGEFRGGGLELRKQYVPYKNMMAVLDSVV